MTSFLLYTLVIFCIGCIFDSAAQSESDPWDNVPLILSRITPPIIPTRICNITEYGAISSPPSDVEAPWQIVQQNSNAFRNAIANCSSLGGGTVHVPSGTYITSAITLKSNISLQLESPTAIIRFTRNTSTYSNVFTRKGGIELINYSPFIYAYEEENIKITGSGIIDGNCDCNNWWPWKGNWSRQCWITTPENEVNGWDNLLKMAANAVPVEYRVFGAGHFMRPVFIQPYKSRNILIEGVTILNSPDWIINPVLCNNIIIRNINLTSLGPNSDGINPESCHDVWINGVHFNSGDDDIAIKSGRNEDGRRINVTTENVVIQNCTFVDGHGGITLGSEISGGVRNIFAENCYMDSPNLDTAFRVKNNAVRGGLVEGFYLRNIVIGRVAKQIIEVDFMYEEGPNGDYRPVLRDMVIDNVTVTGGAPYSMYIRGYPDHPTSSYIELHLRNVAFNGIRNDPHFIINNTDVVSAVNVTVNGELWQVPQE